MKNFTSKFINQDQLPLVIEPSDKNMTLPAFLQALSENSPQIKDQLLKHGGVLLRNFPVKNAEEFAQVIEHLGLGKFVDYIGGDSPRTKVKGAVYTSTEAPPSVKIPLHNELSFVKYFPKHIYFFCETPPQTGGETIIADARKVYQAVDPAVKKRFSQKDLKYVSRYYENSRIMDYVNKFQRSHKSWKEVLEVDTKEKAEKLCHKHEFNFRWNKDNWIELSQNRPATMKHEETQEPIWFNQVHLYDFNPKLLGFWRYLGAKLFYCRKYTKLHDVSYADDSKISRKDIYHVLDVLDANTIYFPWQKGDVLVLDNVLAMHGRATFKGKRRILAAMTA